MAGRVAKSLHSVKASLVFTNTRSQSELWLQALLEADASLKDRIAIHHGSLAQDERREWVLGYISNGGAALRAYPQYHKVLRENGFLHFTDKRMRLIELKRLTPMAIRNCPPSPGTCIHSAASVVQAAPQSCPAFSSRKPSSSYPPSALSPQATS